MYLIDESYNENVRDSNRETVKRRNNCIKKPVWVYARKIKPIFCLRQLIQNNKEKKNNLIIVENLQKGVPLIYIKIIQHMYDEARTSV